MLTELQGQIERIHLHQEENGFTIAEVKVPGAQNLVCAATDLMAPMPGEVIKMQGEWTNLSVRIKMQTARSLHLKIAWYEASEADFAESKDDLIDYGGVLTFPR